MPTSFSKVGVSKHLFEKVAEARLKEFKVLAASAHFVTAIYLAGYGVEALLKCAICKTLDTPNLPVNFQLHDLEDLLDSWDGREVLRLRLPLVADDADDGARLAARDVRREPEFLDPLDDVLDLFQAGVGPNDEDHE